MTPYQAHVKRWKSCTRCPLCEGRKNVVLCRGQLPCDVLFVGEAPGFNEDVVGQPFRGPAGHLLDDMIGDAYRSLFGQGAGWIKFAFTNVVACIPKDESGDKVSDPPDEAVKKCNPRLMEIVQIANPKKLVAVGKVAAKNLCLSGLDADVEIIHPAAILRANAASQGLLYQKAVLTLTELFETL